MGTANDYQKLAHSFSFYPIPEVNEDTSSLRTTVSMPWAYPVMGLTEEAGEVAGKYAKALRDNGGFITPEVSDAIDKELGDVLWFVSELCTLKGTTLEDVMNININKLQSRFNRGRISGSGDNR